MKSSRAWIVYSVIRLGTFVVAFAILLVMNVMWQWAAAVVAAVISLCISYIFLRGPRDRVAADIYARRHGEQHDIDNEIENAALDQIEAERAEHAE